MMRAAVVLAVVGLHQAEGERISPGHHHGGEIVDAQRIPLVSVPRHLKESEPKREAHSPPPVMKEHSRKPPKFERPPAEHSVLLKERRHSLPRPAPLEHSILPPERKGPQEKPKERPHFSAARPSPQEREHRFGPQEFLAPRGERPEDHLPLIPLGEEKQGRSGFNPWDLLGFPWRRHSEEPEKHSLPPRPSNRPQELPRFPGTFEQRRREDFPPPPPEHSAFNLWDLLPWFHHSPGTHQEHHSAPPKPWGRFPPRHRPDDHSVPKPWGRFPPRGHPEDHSLPPKPWGRFPPHDREEDHSMPPKPWGRFPPRDREEDHPEDHSMPPKPWGRFPPHDHEEDHDEPNHIPPRPIGGKPVEPPAFPPHQEPGDKTPADFPREDVSGESHKHGGFLHSDKPREPLLHPPNDVPPTKEECPLCYPPAGVPAPPQGKPQHPEEPHDSLPPPQPTRRHENHPAEPDNKGPDNKPSGPNDKSGPQFTRLP